MQAFKNTWSWGEVTASEESRKESCVTELRIEGSIGGGSITQHLLPGSATSSIILSSAEHVIKMLKFEKKKLSLPPFGSSSVYSLIFT